MRIRQLEIERFGHWHDVAVALAPRGLTVLYGPNETGKSSLVRFIRGMLYGFRPDDERGGGARPRFAGCAGTVQLDAGSDELLLSRASNGGGHADLRRSGGITADAAPTLARLLGGISRDVYERVFAVGLGELQELATLSGDDVAQHVYQASLGDDGERIMDALRRAEAARRELLDSTDGQRGLRSSRNAIRRIDAQLADCSTADARLSSLEEERTRLEAQIAEQQWRQRGLRDQLRGHAFLERVWGPWNRQQKLQREFAALPEVDDFPPDGAARLREIEAGVHDLRRRREQLLQTRRRTQEELQQALGNSRIGRRAGEIRSLLQEHESLRALESQLPALKSRADAARRQLDERLRQLGAGWSESRLERIDGDTGTAVKLFRQADRYRAAARRRARCIRAYRRASSRFQQQTAELAATLRAHSGADLREAENQVRLELYDLHELQRMESQHAAIVPLLAQVRDEALSADKRRDLPAHFYPALAALGISGLVLVVVGIWRFAGGGGLHAALIGAIFTLLGICCGGITWTIKQRLEPTGDDTERWQTRQRRLQADLDGLEREMQQLVGRAAKADDDVLDGEMRIAGLDGVDDVSDAEEISERFDVLTNQLAALSVAGLRAAELSEQRNTLARRRERIRLLQRTVSQARRDWCIVLKEAGLDESVRVAASLDTWQAVQSARRQQLDVRDVQAAIQKAEQSLTAFSEKVLLTAQEGEEQQAVRSAADVLARWRVQLDAATRSAARRTALRKELRMVRSELKSTRKRWRELTAGRRELLARVGAADADDFLRLDAAWRRRGELQTLVDEATEELRQAATSEPELAIVEDDLIQFDGAGNRDAIETIETELSDLENDLRSDHAQLGRLDQEREALQQDRTRIELRFERAQAEHELEHVLQQLGGIELAARALEELRSGLEAERQPATLRSAARYLQQLTGGKYQRVWAPLGERSLVIDDETEQSFRVDQLSSGTREQLFLSIRLALIDEFVRQGAELPIVLDDVFVNFDQSRTKSAVQTVIDYAADGRQLLLLTCHQHLVRLFEEAGATTVRLPEPGQLLDRRRVG